MLEISKKLLRMPLIALVLCSNSQGFGSEWLPDFFHKEESEYHCKSSKKKNVLDGEWPGVGQNYANSGIAEENKIDIHNVGNLRLAWKDTSDEFKGVAIQSQLTCSGKYVYGATSGGNVFARKAKTGDIVWSTTIPEQLFDTSPTITKKEIYISGNKVYCLNRKNGTVKWSAPLYAPGQLADQRSANNIVVGDLVIMGVNGKSDRFRGSVIAFNRHTGQKVWEFFTTSDQTQHHPEYGPGQGISTAPAIDVDRGMVFVGTGNTLKGKTSPLSNSLICLNLKTGSLIWSYQFNQKDSDQYDENIDYEVCGHPILFKVKTSAGCLDLIGISSKDGSFRIFSRDQPNPYIVQPLIHLQLDEASYIQGITSRAIVEKGIIYLASSAYINEHGERTSLDHTQFPPEKGLENILTKTSLRTIALDLRTLLSIGNTDGAIPKSAVIWEKFTQPGMSLLNPLTLAKGVLYQTSTNGFVRALNAKTGDELWRVIPVPISNPNVPIPAFIGSGVTVHKGKVFVTLGLASSTNSLPGGGIAVYELPR